MTIASRHPDWRPLTALAVLVMLGHVLVLSAPVAQLGTGPSLDAPDARTWITRSVDAAPPADPVPGAVQMAAASAKPAKTAQNSIKSASNRPVAQVKRAQAAPETVAQLSPPALPDVPSPTLADPTPTLTITALPESSGATAVAAAAPPPPAGPKTTPVQAVSLPGSVRLLYKVVGMAKTMNYQANAELAWKTNGDSYEAVMKVSAFLIGSRTWTSVGKVTGTGLAPTRFSDKFRAEQAAHFEADKGKITFSANTPEAAWTDGAQDQISVFLQLGGMLAANPPGFPVGSNITFLTAGSRNADLWTFVVESEENVDVTNKSVPALKLTRKPRKEFDQKVELWYAPSLGYLPVRNRITQQNGDFIDQQLTEVVKL